jgi:hypothetical protein
VTEIETDYISAAGQGVVYGVYRNVFLRKISDCYCDYWKMWHPEVGVETWDQTTKLHDVRCKAIFFRVLFLPMQSDESLLIFESL